MAYIAELHVFTPSLAYAWLFTYHLGKCFSKNSKEEGRPLKGELCSSLAYLTLTVGKFIAA